MGRTRSARTALEIRLHDEHVGFLEQQGGSSSFRFSDSYVGARQRPVLGLALEQDLSAPVRGSGRLPSWFANLLPEGRLRDMVSRAYSLTDQDRLTLEFNMLGELGGDLPGGVTAQPVIITGDASGAASFDVVTAFESEREEQDIRFSVAGVGVKFSAVEDGGTFMRPRSMEKGTWLIKMPDPEYPQLPENEHVTLGLAAIAGIEVPDHNLITREQASFIPDPYWCDEEYALAVRRFDRAGGSSIHIEDLAQVRGFYPEQKYAGTFETIGNLLFRGSDTASLLQFVRRLAFNAVVGNGDAHLKNWSLRYADTRTPTLSPAYDLVSVVAYGGRITQDLGLKLHGNRRYDGIAIEDFSRLARLVRFTGGDLEAVVLDVCQRVGAEFRRGSPYVFQDDRMTQRVMDHVAAMTSRLSRAAISAARAAELPSL